MTEKVSSKMSELSLLESQDFDTVMQNDQVRKLFSTFLKEHDASIDNLLTLYLICCCFQNNQGMDDPRRIKQVLEKTYNTCFKKSEVQHLSVELKQKLRESLQRTMYNESVFNAVKSELKSLLEMEYFPKFLRSSVFVENGGGVRGSRESRGEISELLSADERHVDEDAKSLGGKSMTGSFAMPNVPSLKCKQSTSSRALKHSKSTSTSSSSVTKPTSSSTHTSSTSSSKLVQSKNAKHSKSSLSSEPGVSSRYKSPMPPNPYHVASKAIPVSCQDSELQSVVSGDVQIDDPHLINSKHDDSKIGHKLAKFSRQVRQHIMANKDVELHMPEFHAEHAVQPMKKMSEQKNAAPLSESDPQQFFNLLSTKLENYLRGEEEERKVAHTSRAALHISVNKTRSALECCDNEANDVAYESDIDAQLDEHLNRVYNGEVHGLNCMVDSRVKPTSNNVEPNHPQLKLMQQSFNKLSVSSSSFRRDEESLNQHHFYKLTSTSKEVDIDAHHSHQNNNNNNSHNHESKSVKVKNNTSINEKSLGSKLVKNGKQQQLDCDSGVSMRSAASIERVNDWLTTSALHKDDGLQQKAEKVKAVETVNDEPSVKTTVAYYLPGEDLAYISTFNGKRLTLAQFKQLITKKGHFRYFFKTKSDLLDEECVVYQEATDDTAIVPMFNNKVIAKIEKIA